MEEEHLIIFIKNPVLGKVKTRLAAIIGDERALEVYNELLRITRHVTEKVACTKHVFYSDEIENDEWDDDKFNKHVQEGDDLGERMKNAFEKVFALGAKRAVIIGSDCPEISAELIESAFQALLDHDVSIGPAKDGGYYLLGMQRPLTFMFENKQWSTDSVFSSTMADIDNYKLRCRELPLLSDLDRVEELHLIGQ